VLALSEGPLYNGALYSLAAPQSVDQLLDLAESAQMADHYQAYIARIFERLAKDKDCRLAVTNVECCNRLLHMATSEQSRVQNAAADAIAAVADEGADTISETRGFAMIGEAARSNPRGRTALHSCPGFAELADRLERHTASPPKLAGPTASPLKLEGPASLPPNLTNNETPANADGGVQAEASEEDELKTKVVSRLSAMEPLSEPVPEETRESEATPARVVSVPAEAAEVMVEVEEAALKEQVRAQEAEEAARVKAEVEAMANAERAEVKVEAEKAAMAKAEAAEAEAKANFEEEETRVKAEMEAAAAKLKAEENVKAEGAEAGAQKALADATALEGAGKLAAALAKLEEAEHFFRGPLARLHISIVGVKLFGSTYSFSECVSI
jgi:hypothetical protein